MTASSFRFVGLCGLYWSLQYLSVADTTVITFLVPLTTSLAGCVFLKEGYSIRQALAAGERISHAFWSHCYRRSLVCSLLGVVLIARPPFLFGSAVNQVSAVTPAERLMGVG